MLTRPGPQRWYQGGLYFRLHRRWEYAFGYIPHYRDAHYPGNVRSAYVLLGPDERDSIRSHGSRLHRRERPSSVNKVSLVSRLAQEFREHGRISRALLFSVRE